MSRCKNCGKVITPSNTDLACMISGICKDCTSKMGIFDLSRTLSKIRKEDEITEQNKRREERQQKSVELKEWHKKNKEEDERRRHEENKRYLHSAPIETDEERECRELYEIINRNLKRGYYVP